MHYVTWRELIQLSGATSFHINHFAWEYKDMSYDSESYVSVGKYYDLETHTPPSPNQTKFLFFDVTVVQPIDGI